MLLFCYRIIGRSRLFSLDRLGRSGSFLGREVHSHDSLLRTLIHTLAAQTALFKINICKIVFKGNGLKRTSLYTLAATYASHAASLFGYRALVLVDTAHVNPAVKLVLVAQFYYATGTSLGASSASGTFILIHNWQSGLRIHVYGIKLTGLYAITATQTPKETTGLTTVHKGGGSTTSGTIINTCPGTVLA